MVPPSTPTSTVTSRAAQADDEPFLFELYSSTRLEELASWGWDETQQQAFLSLQFRGQRAHYSGYPNVDHQIILADGKPIGRLFISRLAGEIRLVDIALIPRYRGRGIGQQLIQGLLEEATRAGKVVRLHVEESNRALRLYHRLGFEIADDAGPHWLMIWRPANPKDEATGE